LASDLLERVILSFLKKHNFEKYPYCIGGEFFNFYYPDKDLLNILHRSIKHLLCDDISVENESAFSFYLIPSTWISKNTCMTFVRKKFLSDVYQQSTNENQEEVSVYSRAYPEYFYLFEPEKKRILCVINDAIEFSIRCYISPFQYLFQVVMNLLDKYMIHVGAISNGKTGLIFSGGPGAGKTTTTITAILNQYYYVGEDYTILERKNTDLKAYSIYNSIKLTEKTLNMCDMQKVSFSHEPIAIPHNKKKAYFLAEVDDIKIARNTSIQSICALSVGSQKKPILKTASTPGLMKSLILSTLAQSPSFRGKIIQGVQSLVKDKFLYDFVLGLDIDENLKMIDWIFQQHVT